jgi:hypothetical protein
MVTLAEAGHDRSNDRAMNDRAMNDRAIDVARASRVNRCE